MRAKPENPVDFPRTARGAEGCFTEWLLRGFGLIAYILAVSGLASAWWADRSRVTMLLLLLTEGYTLMLVLSARPARIRDMSPMTVVATIYAAFFYVLFETSGTTRLVPELAGALLQVCGTLFQFGAKLALGRSFGLLPAQRGLVVAGPYRLVRHPIYLGYLIGHVGFLLANFSWRNAAVLALLYAAQVIRIRREEIVLADANHDYTSYQQRVRWRLLPFVY